MINIFGVHFCSRGKEYLYITTVLFFSFLHFSPLCADRGVSGLFGEHSQCVIKTLWAHVLVWDVFVTDEEVCHVPSTHR